MDTHLANESLDIATTSATLHEMASTPGDRPQSPESPELDCALSLSSGKTRDEVCVALAQVDAEDMGTPICDETKRTGTARDLEQVTFDAGLAGFDTLEILSFFFEEESMTEFFYLLVLDTTGTWHTLPIAEAYNPNHAGSFGPYESITTPVVTFEDVMGQGTKQLVVRVSHHRHRSYTDTEVMETEDTHSYIIIGRDERGRPELLAHFTDAYSYTRDYYGDGKDTVATPRSEGPLTELTIDLSPKFDGKGHVTLTASDHREGGLEAGQYVLGSTALGGCMTRRDKDTR